MKDTVLAPYVNNQLVHNGVLAEDYTVHVFNAGTATLATIYGNGSLTPIANPQTVNEWGFVSTPIFIPKGLTYDVELRTPADAVALAFDGIAAGQSPTAPVFGLWSGVTQACFQVEFYPSESRVVIQIDNPSAERYQAGMTAKVSNSGGSVIYEGFIVGAETVSGRFRVSIITTTDVSLVYLNSASVTLSAFIPRAGLIPNITHRGSDIEFAGDLTVPLQAGLNVWPIGTVVLGRGFLIAGFSGYIEIRSAQDVSRTTYDLLFDELGTTFGVGDGSTTFGLPVRADVGDLSWYIYAGENPP